ncbi:MAG: cytochrome c biogenesis protein CcsA [Chloroflexi bacterium]|nr:cytochrome c biogenesis protein CcsA [Chloroflexota bacterium]
MAELEVTAHWLAVVNYALATLVAGLAVFLAPQSKIQNPKSKILSLALGLLSLGALAHAAALGLRWLGTGHAPYLGRYEAFSSHALVVVLLYLVLQWRVHALRPGSVVVAPVAFLLLGLALLSPAAPTYPSPALRSPWLTIHVSVAKLALAAAVASGTASLLSLVRSRPSTVDSRQSSVPTLDFRLSTVDCRLWTLELLSHRLLAYTFFLMSVVLLSGSLWASAAWGAFWSWDPVETWSLAFWAGCAFVLHLHLGAGWSGPRWARSVVVLTILGAVTFVGYGHFGVSLHAAYIAP